MTPSELQRDVRQLADRLVAVVTDSDHRALSALVLRLLSPQSPDRRLFPPLLAELTAETAEHIRALAGPGCSEDFFTVDLFGDDEAGVEVDELAPPLRATLRAVLAELHDDSENALVQLDFVAQDPNPLGRLDALLHLATWVSELR
ncbi:hypothetical protein FHX82_001439 [Amycolatopsis bartoniae]|uniref:Uncharacterized protein n=1 Tax=Amycolatopsis bartoniae TaxID=941986 RepID=A0A8H9ISP5_9PSEU|nr:hypothetical protein [Amycolatopsis bartoniae]MBB2934419.1 hypothetical protein [Amycolatopsis bartoniae]TVT02949.1 hypothetical protein FNH07_26490 [Amycolatopsis bartoniae]GHF47499.1 hypothetical protein GCM10017566_20880 [Amycolatopsis bartoniae]